MIMMIIIVDFMIDDNDNDAHCGDDCDNTDWDDNDDGSDCWWSWFVVIRMVRTETDTDNDIDWW